LQEVLVFGLATDQSLLSDLGENFLISPARSRELVLDQFDAASTKDSQDREESKESPINSQESWVKLRIRYADKIQENQEIEDLIKNAQDQDIQPDPDNPGHMRVAEPGEGQVVGFVVENISKERIGVVLKVNGQNTLFEENDEPQRCTKWILDPGEQVTITGIQVTDQESIPFKVLSEADSEEAYSDKSGTFELCVFRSGGEEPGKQITKRISLRGLTERQSVRKPAKTLTERQRQLRQNVPRGLVVPDKEKGTRPDPTERVSFPNPVQVMLQTIHYYKAKET
jgi:hypothetical protein